VTGPPRERRRLAPWLLAVGYCAVIFALSSVENPLPALTDRISDKVLHGVEYAGLGGLLAVALALTVPRLRPARILVLAALLASLYGASDEVHQSFVPGREADPRDWAADSAGGLVGAGAAVAFLRRARSAG
jgi:VanZ family protein